MRLTQDQVRALEWELSNFLKDGRCFSVLAADTAGRALAIAGEPPVHPNQIAGIVSAVFTGMSAITKASRGDEFLVRLSSNSLNIQFWQMDTRAFVCAFYRERRNERPVRENVKALVERVRARLGEEQTIDRRDDNAHFIEKKLSSFLHDRTS